MEDVDKFNEKNKILAKKISGSMGIDDEDPSSTIPYFLDRINESQERLNFYTKILAGLTGILVVLTTTLIYYTIH